MAIKRTFFLADAGNSALKLCASPVRDTDKPVRFSYENGFQAAAEAASVWLKKKNADQVLLCTVQREAGNIFLGCCLKLGVPAAEALRKTPAGLKVRYNLKQIGMDRLMNAAGARERYHQKNLLVFSLGTAVTVEIIEDNILEGGFIFPGLNTMLQSLYANTSLLPKLKVAGLSRQDLIPHNTSKAMQQGCRLAVEGALIQIVQRVSKIRGKSYFCVVTGGDGKDFQGVLSRSVFDPLLLFKGLEHW